MPRTVLIILLTLALLTPAVAQGAEEKADRSGRQDDARPGPKAEPQNPTAQDKRDAQEAEREARDAKGHGNTSGTAVGSFELDTAKRSAKGEYVSFQYDATGVQDFAVDGVPIFNLTASDAAGDRRVSASSHGAQMIIEQPSYRLQVHDNPTAATKLRSDGNVTFAFAIGTTLQSLDAHRLRFAIDGVSGTLRGTDLRVDENSVTVDGDALVLLDSPRGGFDKHRSEISDAVSARKVGAELSLNRRDGTIEEDAVSYENVTLTTVIAKKGNVTILIDGQGMDGRVLVFNLEGSVIGAKSIEDLDIKFDNGTIARADSLADVLDPDDDGLLAEYYVVYDPIVETFQLIVSVPHYSVHVLSVGTIILPIQPSVVIGVLAGVALLVPTAFVLFRRRG